MPPPGQLAIRIARLVERRGSKSGPRLSRALERMGPAYLKLGQFLATRPDVVGVVLASDLESLQDRLPPFPQARIFLPLVRQSTIRSLACPICGSRSTIDRSVFVAAPIALFRTSDGLRIEN